MNDQERAALKAEIISELKEAGMLKEPPKSATPLREPYRKWFRGEKGKNRMEEVFSVQSKWKVWEAIRLLTCHIVGAERVAKIPNNGEAAEICEKLCQFVYDLRKEYKNNGTDGKD